MAWLESVGTAPSTEGEPGTAAEPATAVQLATVVQPGTAVEPAREATLVPEVAQLSWMTDTSTRRLSALVGRGISGPNEP